MATVIMHSEYKVKLIKFPKAGADQEIFKKGAL